MRYAMSMILLLAVFAACASVDVPRRTVADVGPLLDGDALFGETVPDAEEIAILALSEEMRVFVDDALRMQTDSLRLKRLIAAMQRERYLDLDYSNERTLTAAETFASRRGNCLSFTNLFVALARASRLEAKYQVVDVPPSWDSVDGWVIVNTHIDVIVRGVSSMSGLSTFRRDYVVDFNMADFQTAYPRRIVKDRTAFALFYSNRGVEAMRAGDLRNAFANFKRAISEDPTEPSAWVNLGALYSRQGRYDFAQTAYEKALSVDSNDKSAMTNLAKLNDERGDAAAAAAYRARIARYEQTNPYYHFSLAEQAYQSTDYATALEEIKRAVALKADDHRFFFLQGLVHYRMGDLSNARSSLQVAERLSDESAVKQRYASKLAALGLKNG